MDDNFARMKKSCERIAAVLGIKEGPNGIATASASFGNKNASRGAPGASSIEVPESIHGADPAMMTDYHGGSVEPMTYTNMDNPSRVGRMVKGPNAEDGDGQPSGYKSLREKSPTRKSRSPVKRGVDE